MNKEIMLSIQPKHLVNILNGTKTLELRKTVQKDYVGWVYIYCTKGNEILEYSFLGYRTLRESSFYNNGIGISLNGKVVARFWFDNYDTYAYIEMIEPRGCLDYNDNWVDMSINHGYGYMITNEELEKMSLTYDEVLNYGKRKTLHTWHIKKLEIFDKQKDLSDFYKTTLYASGKVIKEYEKQTNDLTSYRLQRPPQSWQYVYKKGELK